MVIENTVAANLWSVHRAERIFDALSRNSINLLWEIGSGNGNAALPLSNFGIPVICLEPLKSGASQLSKSGFVVFCDLLENLNLPDDSIEAIGVFDVLNI
jgi:hypothetical protein